MESLGVLLPTTDQEVMAQFLTEIIECDIEANEEKISFELFNQKFILEKSKLENVAGGISLRFECAPGDIEDLAQKLEFFKYRHQESTIDSIASEGVLTIVDADKRHWVFSSRGPIQ